MLTCIILCKGFSRGSRLMQRFLPGFSALGCSGLCKVPKSRLQGVPALPDSIILLLQSPASVGNPGQQGFFHGDGLLWTHLLTAVTLDALAVIILHLAVSHFYGLAFYRAGTYADPAAHTFFPLHHRLLFQEWLQKTDRL